MKSILTLFSLLLFVGLHAQTDTASAQSDTSLKEFKTVQIQAQFPGGINGWRQYLIKNLRAEVAADNIVLKRRQKDSSEIVIVSFLVDKEGNVNEVRVANPETVNPAVGAEAVRVIAKGPKWLPATQNGKPVIYRQRQTLTFVVSKG